MGNTYRPSDYQDDPQTEEELEQAIAEEQAAEETEGEQQEQTEGESTSDEESDANPDEEPAASEPEQETPAPDEEPAASEPEQETTQETSAETDADAQEESAEPAQTLSAPLKMVKARLDDYVEKMRPALPISESDILTNQASLYRAFKTVLNLTGRDFTEGLNLLVSYFKEHRSGVFAEKYSARGFDNIALGGKDRLAFSRLMRLVRVTANVGNVEQVRKHVDLEKVLDALPAHSHEKLIEYYSAQ